MSENHMVNELGAQIETLTSAPDAEVWLTCCEIVPKVKGKSKSRFFSLTELLIVIAILAILVSLLQPSLSRMLDSANNAYCLSHHKELATLLFLYSEDYDFILPPITNGLDFQNSEYGGNGRFMTYMQGYIANRPTIKWGAGSGPGHPSFICPSDLDPRSNINNSDHRKVSYSVNYEVWSRINDRYQRYKLPSGYSQSTQKTLPMDDIRYPSVTASILDGNSFDGVFDNQIDIKLGVHTGWYTIDDYGQRLIGGSPTNQKGITLRHQGGWGYNAQFFDGHSRSYLAPEISPSLYYNWVPGP